MELRLASWLRTLSLPCWVGLAVTIAVMQSAAADEILIYYANENRPVGLELENYNTFNAWLREIDTAKSRKLADGLMSDRVAFPAAVDEEIQLVRNVETGVSQPPAIVFTNELARDGRCLRISSSGIATEERFDVDSTGDLLGDGNPLCRGEVLAAALRRTASLYAPSRHQFILITKSHGSPDFALTVRLARDFRDFTREKVEAMLEDPSQSEAPSFGISKPQYFDILARAGTELGMRFRLVFVESCRGTIAPETISKFPSNIEALFASGDRSLNYQTLDYNALLTTARDGSTLSAAIHEQLDGKYLAISRSSPPSLRRRLAWFLPALLLLFAYIAKMSRRLIGDSATAIVNRSESHAAALQDSSE